MRTVKKTLTAEQLKAKHPKILGKVALACDKGWFPLINDLCSQLQFNVDHNQYPQLEATQVKEKYGTLRFYYSLTPTKPNRKFLFWENRRDRDWNARASGVQEGLVSFAEYLSGGICERCGSNQGRQTTSGAGWLSTLCTKCKK